MTKAKVKTRKLKQIYSDGSRWITNGHWICKANLITLSGDKELQTLVSNGIKFSRKFNQLMTGDDAVIPDIESAIPGKREETELEKTTFCVDYDDTKARLFIRKSDSKVIGIQEGYLSIAELGEAKQGYDPGDSIVVRDNDGNMVALIMPVEIRSLSPFVMEE